MEDPSASRIQFSGPPTLQTQPFAATDYTATGALVWTVVAADVQTFKFTIEGKIMSVWFRSTGTTTSGIADSRVHVLIPGGRQLSHEVVAPAVCAPAALASEVVIAFMDPALPTLIQLLRTAATWPVGTPMDVNFAVSFPIVPI